MNRTAFFSALLLSCLMAGSKSFGQPYRCNTVIKGEQIVIDGIADEESWRNAPPADMTLYLNDFPAEQWGALAQKYILAKKHYAKALWDSVNLYLHFFLESPHVWNTLEGRDVSGYYDENAAEVFLDPDGDGEDYIELNISAGGDLTDLLRVKNASNFKYDIDGIEWAVDYLGATTFCKSNLMPACNQDTDSGFTVEIKIPFASIARDRLPATRKAKDEHLDSLPPPAITQNMVTNWPSIHTILKNGTPAPLAGIMEARIDASVYSAIQTALELNAEQKQALIDAFNGIVNDVDFYPSIAADITLKQKLSNTETPSYPLNDTNVAVQVETLKDSVDTQYVSPECSVIDTILIIGDSTSYKAPRQLMARYEKAIDEEALLVDDASVELGDELTAEDSTLLKWLNVSLLDEAFFPKALAVTKTILDTLTMPVRIMGANQSLPPDRGDTWKGNFYFVTSPPCSLIQGGIKYSWASIDGNPHKHSHYSQIEFVAIPDTSSAVLPHNRKAGIHGFSIRALSPRRIAIDLPVLKSSASVYEVTLFSADGAAIVTQKVAPFSGTRVIAVTTPLASGAYVLQLKTGTHLLHARFCIFE